MINILCTSKPHDGLFYYSYEYCCYLNSIGASAQLIVACHHGYLYSDYRDAIDHKYIYNENVIYDDYIPDPDDVTLVMGRSMITLAYLNISKYNEDQVFTLHELLSGKVISVYSENHPEDYPKALEYFNPDSVVDLCDHDVYPNGVGKQFEKRINFDVYKPHKSMIQYKYIFMGTNKKYYQRIQEVIGKYPDSGIICYDEDYLDPNLNNLVVPINNLLGIFDTYVYTKSTFDPAPRIIQECQYYNKPIIYDRDLDIVDGGSVYMNRTPKKPDVSAILECI